jgi:DNA-binding MarR family transcriptional regulator
MNNLLPEKDKRSIAEGGGEILLGSGITPLVPKNSYELRILQSIRRIIRAVEIHSQKLIQGYEITGPQLACLLALAKGGPLTITQLASRVYLSPSTIVGIVDRLADKGMAIRQRGSKDRRQVQVCVTEGGEALIASAPSPLQETLTESLKNLPELEQVSITLALEKVVDMMEARKIEASPVLEVGPISPKTGNGITPPEAF